MKRRLLARIAFVAVLIYAAGVSLALWSKNADLDRERRRVAHVVLMLSLTKFWLRDVPIKLDHVPPGYDRVAIEDSTPHWRNDAKRMILLSPPQPPPESHLRSAPHFSDIVFGGFYALYVDERGRFVDLEWSKP